MKGNFEKIINADLPVLIDFHAEWCGPCKMLAPIIKEVAKEMKGNIRIIKLDVDKNQSISQRFNVQGVPTLALFKKGQIVWRQSGVLTKHQIIENINQYV